MSGAMNAGNAAAVLAAMLKRAAEDAERAAEKDARFFDETAVHADNAAKRVFDADKENAGLFRRIFRRSPRKPEPLDWEKYLD